MASSRRVRRRWRRRFVVAAIVVVALVVGVLGLRALVPDRRDPDAARAAIARALGELKTGNPTAAGKAAQAAALADPTMGLGHAVLARTQLALGEGVGASAALDRAARTGFDMRRAHQLRAHAMLLQGDPRRAAAEVAKSLPRYTAYADRVRAGIASRMGDDLRAEQLLEAAVDARPGDAAAWTALGRYRIGAGDERGAILASIRAVAADPRQVDALLLRAEMVRAQFGLVGALPWFERALARDPEHFPTLIAYAATLGDVGRTRDMLAAVRRAEAVRRGSPQALYLQAVLAARARRFALAEAIVARLGSAGEDIPGVLLLKGALELQAGRFEQAIGHLRALVAQQPMNLTARKLLAAALARSDASRNAIEVLRPVVDRGDADSYALALTARAYERIGEYETASALLDRSAMPARGGPVAFSPDQRLDELAAAAQASRGGLGPTIGYVRALMRAGDVPRAYAEARALAQRWPGASPAQVVVGDVLMLAGQPAPAADAYARAASIRYDEPVMLRLVEALDVAGKRAEAANALALFVSQNPANIAALRLGAHWQVAAGDHDAAIDTLEGLRARTGNRDAGLLAELGLAYLGAGEGEYALRFARAAYALQPQNPAVADAYGRALGATGDTGGAVQLLRKAAAIAPGHPAIRAHLAQAMAELRAS